MEMSIFTKKGFDNSEICFDGDEMILSDDKNKKFFVDLGGKIQCIDFCGNDLYSWSGIKNGEQLYLEIEEPKKIDGLYLVDLIDQKKGYKKELYTNEKQYYIIKSFNDSDIGEIKEVDTDLGESFEYFRDIAESVKAYI